MCQHTQAHNIPHCSCREDTYTSSLLTDSSPSPPCPPSPSCTPQASSSLHTHRKPFSVFTHPRLSSQSPHTPHPSSLCPPKPHNTLSPHNTTPRLAVSAHRPHLHNALTRSSPIQCLHTSHLCLQSPHTPHCYTHPTAIPANSTPLFTVSSESTIPHTPRTSSHCLPAHPTLHKL